MYETDAKSETALARAVHILTLGAYAWEEDSSEDKITIGTESWRLNGGGDVGSVFYDRTDGLDTAPKVCEWVEKSLLRKPEEVMNSPWYEGEENALLLLSRLSRNQGVFSAQDQSLKLGAAWLW